MIYVLFGIFIAIALFARLVSLVLGMVGFLLGIIVLMFALAFAKRRAAK